MAPVIAAIGWILYLVIVLRQDILTAFAYTDAPLILLAVILYLRILRQRQSSEKESGTMWSKRSTATEDELFDALVSVAEPALDAAEQAIPVLDEAMADLPDIDRDGEVRRIREILAASSKELRKQLTVALGPATIKGVRKNVELIWDAIAKTEEIRLRTKLEKDAHSYAVARIVANARINGEGFRQMRDTYKELLVKSGLEHVNQLGDEEWATALARLTMVGTGPLFAKAAGMAEGANAVDVGKLLFSPDQKFASLPKPSHRPLDDDELLGPHTIEKIESGEYD